MRGYLSDHPLPPDFRTDPPPKITVQGDAGCASALIPDTKSKHVMGREFYAKFTGIQLRDFPCVPIKLSGLVDTDTHKLAIETDPQWTLVIRHVGSWRVKTRPKARLYPADKAFGKAPAFCFAMPACFRFDTAEQAFEWMKTCDFELSPHNVNVRAVQKRDEHKLRQIISAEERQKIWDSMTEEETFAMLEHFTRTRLAKLPRPKRKAEPDLSNVLNFEDIRRRIEAILADQEDADTDLRASLRASA